MGLTAANRRDARYRRMFGRPVRSAVVAVAAVVAVGCGGGDAKPDATTTTEAGTVPMTSPEATATTAPPFRLVADGVGLVACGRVTESAEGPAPTAAEASRLKLVFLASPDEAPRTITVAPTSVVAPRGDEPTDLAPACAIRWGLTGRSSESVSPALHRSVWFGSDRSDDQQPTRAYALDHATGEARLIVDVSAPQDDGNAFTEDGDAPTISGARWIDADRVQIAIDGAWRTFTVDERGVRESEAPLGDFLIDVGSEDREPWLLAASGADEDPGFDLSSVTADPAGRLAAALAPGPPGYDTRGVLLTGLRGDPNLAPTEQLGADCDLLIGVTTSSIWCSDSDGGLRQLDYRIEGDAVQIVAAQLVVPANGSVSISKVFDLDGMTVMLVTDYGTRPRKEQLYTVPETSDERPAVLFDLDEPLPALPEVIVLSRG